jgi:dihydropyrimidinase
MPGLHVRMPLLFDAMVSKGRLGLAKFVELTAEAPARIYNLAGKGAIAVGADADIAIWDPNKRVTLTAAGTHDRAGYTPYEGREVVGWPETVLARGRVIVHDGQLLAKPGEGRFLARAAGDAAKGTGRMAPEFDPARNFGAKLM